MGKSKNKKKKKPVFYDAQILSEVHKLFNNYFTYPEIETNTHLSEIFTCKAEPWTNPALQELKRSLNETKESLSSLDIDKWHGHTKQSHPGGLIIRHVRSRVRAEFCTQAWCKFWEVISSFDLVPGVEDGDETFNSVHLCEAPGAFVASLNHFLNVHDHPSPWRWLAVTLNPYYEGHGYLAMVDDDRLIVDTLDSWYFGDDDSGDIMRPEMTAGLRERVAGNAQLVTGDGSIDCSDVPEAQESVTSHLHYCEVVCALHVLAIGGSLVVKMFTMFEAQTISLMYLLRCAFSQLSVFKPVTSKPGNSEVYVVAQGYKGLPDDTLTTLRAHMASPPSSQTPLCPLSALPESFLRAHHSFCEHFTQNQILAITQNVRIFLNDQKQKDQAAEGERQTQRPRLDSEAAETSAHIHTLREACLTEFLRRFYIAQIPPERRLVQHRDKPLDASLLRPYQCVRNTGSYSHRQSQLQLTWAQRVQRMEYLKDTGVQGRYTLQPPPSVPPFSRWRLVHGSRPRLVQSSRFCTKSLLMVYTEILQHAEPAPTAAYTDHLRGMTEEVMLALRVDTADLPLQLRVTETDTGGLLGEVLADQLNQKPSSPDESESVPHVHCVDLYTAGMAETEWCVMDRNITDILHKVLQVMSVGDALVMTSPPLLTRMNAGLLFCLRFCFTQVSMIIPSEATFPVCLLVANGYQAPPPSLRTHLELVHSVTMETEGKTESCLVDSTRRVLSFVPIPLLCESPFNSDISQSNDAFIVRRVNFLLKLEKGRLGQSTEGHRENMIITDEQCSVTESQNGQSLQTSTIDDSSVDSEMPDTIGS